MSCSGPAARARRRPTPSWSRSRRSRRQVRLGQVDTVKHAREQHLSLRVFVGQVGRRRLHLRSLARLAGARWWTRRCRSRGSRRPTSCAACPSRPSCSRGRCRTSTSTTRRATTSRPRRRSSWRGAARRRPSRPIRASPTPRAATSATGAPATPTRRSHGFAGEYATSSFSLVGLARWPSENGEMQRDCWYHVDAASARALEAPEEIGRIAARRALRRLGARQVKTAEVPVVFDPEMAASLVRHIAGAAAGPALYRRASFLLGKLGERIAAPGVTIVDDGTIPGALGLAALRRRGAADAAHRARGRGRAAARTCSTPTAAASSGMAVDASRRARRQRGERVAPRICYLEPGRRRSGGPDPEREERPLRHRADRLRRQRGHRRLLARARSACGSRTASWPTRSRRSPIAGNLLDMFRAIEGVGNDLVFRDRTAAPTLLIGRMMVAGTERGPDDHRQPLPPARPGLRGRARRRSPAPPSTTCGAPSRRLRSGDERAHARGRRGERARRCGPALGFHPDWTAHRRGSRAGRGSRSRANHARHRRARRGRAAVVLPRRGRRRGRGS